VATGVEEKKYSKEYGLPRVAAGIKRRYCMQSRHCNLSVHEWITRSRVRDLDLLTEAALVI
jgi:hypothetical protein